MRRKRRKRLDESNGSTHSQRMRAVWAAKRAANGNGQTGTAAFVHKVFDLLTTGQPSAEFLRAAGAEIERRV